MKMQEALLSRRADCLGYTRIFEILGSSFGLDLGVVEMVVDNAGRYVPHQVILCLLATGERRFVDPWYGSRDTRPRRIGALVKRKGRWRVEDVDKAELDYREALKDEAGRIRLLANVEDLERLIELDERGISPETSRYICCMKVTSQAAMSPRRRWRGGTVSPIPRSRRYYPE